MKKLLIALLLAALLVPATVAEIHPVRPPAGMVTLAPTPTPEPHTSEYFDYDAIIAEPDTYKDFYYQLVCEIARVDEVEMDILNWEHPVMALMSVDGDVGQVVYIAFDNPGGTLRNGDTVYLFAQLIKVTDVQTAFGFYVRMPMLLAYSIERIPE